MYLHIRPSTEPVYLYGVCLWNSAHTFKIQTLQYTLTPLYTQPFISFPRSSLSLSIFQGFYTDPTHTHSHCILLCVFPFSFSLLCKPQPHTPTCFDEIFFQLFFLVISFNSQDPPNLVCQLNSKFHVDIYPVCHFRYNLFSSP